MIYFFCGSFSFMILLPPPSFPSQKEALLVYSELESSAIPTASSIPISWCFRVRLGRSFFSCSVPLFVTMVRENFMVRPPPPPMGQLSSLFGIQPQNNSEQTTATDTTQQNAQRSLFEKIRRKVASCYNTLPVCLKISSVLQAGTSFN